MLMPNTHDMIVISSRLSNRSKGATTPKQQYEALTPKNAVIQDIIGDLSKTAAENEIVTVGRPSREVYR